MNLLFEQFLSESRDCLQGIDEKLMQLESAPDDADLINELFRLIHTLKGNSGLFDLPEMTRVLHAGEDLMDAVRKHRVIYSQSLADKLLNAMDFVGILCSEIEAGGRINASRAADSARLAEALRALLASQEAKTSPAPEIPAESAALLTIQLPFGAGIQITDIPEIIRATAIRHIQDGNALYWITYNPTEDCFYHGDDPFFTARQTPGLLWGRAVAHEPWPTLTDLDAYRCVLDFICCPHPLTRNSLNTTAMCRIR